MILKQGELELLHQLCFYAKFLLNRFDVSSDFYARDFFAYSLISVSFYLIHSFKQMNSIGISSLPKVK